MFYSNMNDQLLPSCIHVIEEYVYKARVSGVRQIRMEKKPSGLIEVIAHHTKRHYPSRPIAGSAEQWSVAGLRRELLATQLGHLQINHYGHSNLNHSLDPSWDEDTVPIQIEIDSHQLEDANIREATCFDLHMTHSYQPEKPDEPPIMVSVRVKDEDYIDPQERKREETVEEKLVREISNQAGLKHSLTVGFQVRLILPNHLGVKYNEDPPCVSQMMLAWPIATPCRLVNLNVDFAPSPSFIFDPENGYLEWTNVVLKYQGKDDVRQLHIFSSNWMYLEISEPIEIYQVLELSGKAIVELDGLFSGVVLDYCLDTEVASNPVPITTRTVLANEFTLNLEEGLELKHYSPRQHLYFPGVVLNEMRVTDIILLLEDKGFEFDKHKSGWKKQTSLDNSSLNEKTDKRFYKIEATRPEGARTLTLFMLLQGTDYGTTREREIFGQTKYTTPLPTGATTIYIRGQLQGDSKRAVNVINEIQKQLKEQFRHVGAVE